jgi:hypothetical protein
MNVHTDLGEDMETTPLSEIIYALESNEDFQDCPVMVQDAIRVFVENLHGKDWDNWSAELGMDFVETLLMRIFRLPQ